MFNLLKRIVIGLAVAAGIWTAGSAFVVAGIEEAKYTVQQQRAGFEVRAYAPALVAQTAMPTMSRADTGAAFRALAGYIFGGTEAGASISMTAPVVMDVPRQPEKIAMTAPVVMGAGTMTFVLPSKYKTLAELPKPKDPKVTLGVVPRRTVAALRFSWYATQARFAGKSAELLACLERDGLRAVSKPYLASYDPPFSIPFLKRHDVLVDIEAPVSP